jgi:ankyrin repeat protein
MKTKGERLLDAASSQQWDKVGKLLQLPNIDCNWCFTKGGTAGYYSLHFLVLHNQRELIKQYFAHGRRSANLHLDTDHPTPLSLAIDNPQVTPETLACLLKYAHDLTYDASKLGNSLLIAASIQQWDKVGIILSKLPAIDCSWCFTEGDTAGYYALHFLVLHNKQELIQQYFAHGRQSANLQLDTNHPTPLSLAIDNPQVTTETLACLLKGSLQSETILIKDVAAGL